MAISCFMVLKYDWHTRRRNLNYKAIYFSWFDFQKNLLIRFVIPIPRSASFLAGNREVLLFSCLRKPAHPSCVSCLVLNVTLCLRWYATVQPSNSSDLEFLFIKHPVPRLLNRKAAALFLFFPLHFFSEADGSIDNTILISQCKW